MATDARRARRRLPRACAATFVGCLLAAGGAAAGEVVPSPTADGSVPFRATSRHGFADVEHWRSVFDDPARDVWQKPDAVVATLDIRPGMTVADLGAGTGYLSRRLADAVGAEGVVLAVETEPNLVAHLRQRAEREHTPNVTPVLASADNPRLPPGAVDRVLILDTFHHIDRRLEYFRAFRRFLAPGGRIVIVDWQKRDLPVGPPRAHKLTRAQVVREMQEAGYRLVAESDVLPYQYLVVFEPG